MNRITPADVKLLTGSTLSDDIVLLWIDAANCVVNDNQTCINADDDKLAQIELYLTAHYLALQNPSQGGIRTSERIEGLAVTYANNATMTAREINNTVYGKMANTLSGGCLASTEDESIALYSIGGENNAC